MLQAVLGCAELNWDLVAKHLGRGKRSVQRKYDNLRTGMQAAGGRRRGGGWAVGHQCVCMGGVQYTAGPSEWCQGESECCACGHGR